MSGSYIESDRFLVCVVASAIVAIILIFLRPIELKVILTLATPLATVLPAVVRFPDFVE